MSYLDQIFVMYSEIGAVKSTVIQRSVTGLYSTALTFNTGHGTDKPPPMVTHKYIDYEIPSESLSAMDWQPVTNCNDVNECSQLFSDIVKEQTKLYTVSKKYANTRYLKLKPLITTSLIKSIRVKDKLSKSLKNKHLILT